MHFPDLDIFCTVVDNYGDIGFSYRFARQYQKRHSKNNVRLFVDKPEVLKKIRIPGDTIKVYASQVLPETMAPLVMETFGCNIPEIYLPKIKTNTRLWVNLEYLSAEDWTLTCHGKESPQAIPGLKKLFYMPGFTTNTGGILTDFKAVQKSENIISIFTYTQDFSLFFKACNQLPATQFLIFDQYAQKSMTCDSPAYPKHSFVMSPFVTQEDYDAILAKSELNLVRGEESLIRAILAGKPFLWQAYPQENNHQLVKVQALLKTLEPFFKNKHIFQEYAKLMLAWNGDNKPVAVDNWLFLLENLPAVGLFTQAFGQHLRQNCDMGLLFDQFITQNW